MGHLLSKLVAGGLSAGVVLIWWPLVFPSDTVESWLVRGIVWTASFELILHSFIPIEESLWRSRAARRVRDKAAQASGRIAPGKPEQRMRLRTGVACLALVIPLALLATAPAHPLGPKPTAEQVREVTKVKRIVRVETKRVKVPQQMATARVPSNAGVVPATPASAAVPVPARRVVQRRSTVRPTPTAPAKPPQVEQPSTGNAPAAAAPGQPAPGMPATGGQ